jgi:Na+-transporting NADH:ubiquinone oxidoreductase subunit B
MDSLRKKIDKIKPHFTEGGRFSKFRSVFEGFESFLFVPNRVTYKGSHVRDSIDLKRTMTVVIIALLPALLFGAYNIGLQHCRSIGADAGTIQMFWFGFLKILPLLIVSYVTGLGIEFIAAQIRGHEINEGFLVTGILIRHTFVDAVSCNSFCSNYWEGGFWRNRNEHLQSRPFSQSVLIFQLSGMDDRR